MAVSTNISILTFFILHFIARSNFIIGRRGSYDNVNDDKFNEVEDSRYNTQTYKFSLDDLNKAYNDLINNRSRLLDVS
ncbi:unnamed protein product [Rhizophagus irregularis]|nr:unnamed protein product [Rhizophagus irregularis]